MRWKASRRKSCFNGATSFRTWKCTLTSGHFDHWTCFNGATSFRTWKYVAVCEAVFLCGLLQWSHILSDVEMLFAGFSFTSAKAASMEPHPFGRGNNERRTLVHGLTTGFNGATSFRTWKFISIKKESKAKIASMEPHPFGRGNSYHFCKLPNAF